MSILFIHCRKGLYQLTRCKECDYVWECKNCSAKLTTYRDEEKNLYLLCHQCQTSYLYPKICPKCSSKEVFSLFEGVDNLIESLEKKYKCQVVRLDQIKKKKNKNLNSTISELKKQKPVDINFQESRKVYVTTRIYDPSIDYNFEKIIFIQAENLLASPDYLVQEEVFKQLAELFFTLENQNFKLNFVNDDKTLDENLGKKEKDKQVEIIFDTQSNKLDLFQSLTVLNQDLDSSRIFNWYLSFLEQELKIRQTFQFPPFVNLLLLTSQESNQKTALEKIEQSKQILDQYLTELPDIQISNPYPAKFLKRKNRYSFHLLIRYPTQYKFLPRLRELILWVANQKNLQIRKNPRHLF